MKREAKFTLQFRHWLKANPQKSAAFELKQTMTDSIPFSDLQEHQADALLAVKSSKGLLYKAPDDSRGVKPFDLFYMVYENAFVVVKFPDVFCVIDIDVWMHERQNSTRKSLTVDRARKIATYAVA